jgi:hypothetical protein
MVACARAAPEHLLPLGSMEAGPHCTPAARHLGLPGWTKGSGLDPQANPTHESQAVLAEAIKYCSSLPPTHSERGVTVAGFLGCMRLIC